MMEAMTLGITLMAFDKMSRVISNACNQSNDEFSKLQNKIKNVSDTMEKVGKTMTVVGAASVAAGAGILYAMQKPIKAFADLEDASNGLKMTMMDKNGNVSKYFGEISKQAVQLGNDLPGTTADFYDVAASLQALGVSEKAVAGGVLKSAAYLGIALKRFGVDYQQAAEYAAKFKEALAIDEKEMMPFMDLIQRTAYMGVSAEQMKYAFSKVSGTVQLFGMTGLKAATSLTPLVAMLIKTGKTGEVAGSSLNHAMTKAFDISSKIEKLENKAHKKTKKSKGLSESQKETLSILKTLKFNDSKGNFAGIENFIAQLDKLNKYDVQKKSNILKTIFGESGETLDTAKYITMKGVKGYQAIQKQMEKQASLDQKVKLGLSSLNNTWEAFTGTITNTLALIGDSLAPELKNITNKLNAFTGKVFDFIKLHPRLTKMLSWGALGLGASLVVLGSFSIAIGGASFAIGKMTEGYGKFLDISRKLTPVLKQNAIQLLKQSGLSRTADFIKNPSLNKGLAQANPYFKNQGYGSLLGNLNQDIFKNSKSAKTFDKIFNKETYTKMPSNLMGAFNKQLTSSERTLELFKRNSNMNFIQISSNFKKFAGSLSVKSMFTGALSGIWSVIRTFGILNLTLLTSPIFWIGIAIGSAALLIYKYWKPITAFFKGVWQGIVIATKPLHPAFAKIGKALSPLIKWFKGLIKPVDDVGGKSQALGLKVGTAIGGCINWVVKFGKQLWDLSKPFRDLIGWIAKIALKLQPLYWLFKGGKWAFDMTTKDGNGKVTKHHTGLRLSPNEHWAVILKNEAVLNPKEAEIYRKNGLGKTVNLPSISHNFTAPRTKETLMKNIQSSQKPIVVHNSPTFNITGSENAKDIENQIQKALAQNSRELVRLFQQLLKNNNHEQGRRSFA